MGSHDQPFGPALSGDMGEALAPVAPLDMETRLGDDDHQAVKLWLRLLSCTTRVEAVIRQRLRTEFGTTLPRFDLLAQLERHPEGLTMRELSQRLMVTGGNVTGITDQLEAEGHVLRSPHPTDRRAFQVKLTPQGRRQFARMASTHEQWVVALLAGWSPADKTQIQGLLGILKHHLAAQEGVADTGDAVDAAEAVP